MILHPFLTVRFIIIAVDESAVPAIYRNVDADVEAPAW